jgi:arylsulfatase A-like enzyme
MKLLMISIDSLRRDFLEIYDSTVDMEVATPNLDRFAERAAVFENHYAGSLPCMPARREWLTGTQEFLWRPWGPIEPFDTTVPSVLRERKVVTQLITDHYHYFQHGSGGYYEDFNGFEYVRGHEYDAWKTAPRVPQNHVREQLGFSNPDDPLGLGYLNPIQYPRNVGHFETEADFFAPKVFSRTANWITDNQEWDEWFCYVDSFDVHEPFHIPQPYSSMYTDQDPTDHNFTFWPPYGRIDEGGSELSEGELEFVCSQFAGKLTMTDRWFGRVLDVIDDHELWDDLMMIVTSDHGYYLGEHGWSGKPFEAPIYDVLAHTPLFIWHPTAERVGDQITQLTTAVDINATLLDAFSAVEAAGPHSRSLMPILHGECDTHRDWAIYGYWGSSVNITDGRYTYHHPCADGVDSECYSSRMINPHSWFTPPEIQPNAESGTFLPYTDSPVWRYTAPSYSRHSEPLLFDTDIDPQQTSNLAVESNETNRLQRILRTAFRELNAPQAQYDRLELSPVDD